MNTNEQLTLSKAFEKYLNVCKYTKRLSPETIKGRRTTYDMFAKLMPEITSIEDLHPLLVDEFFQRLSTRKRNVGNDTEIIGVRQSTIHSYFGRLMVFFSWLESSGYIENERLTKNVTRVSAPLYDDFRAFTQEEIAQILSTITLHNTNNRGLFLRDISIVCILLYTGIRRNELISLNINDVNFEDKTVFISSETSKSKKSRYIPLNPICANHIINYLNFRREQGSTSPSLFTSSIRDEPLTKHGIKYWAKRYSKLTGVHIHPHRFRHTFACALARSNANIITLMSVMGHSSIKMTERYLRSIRTESSRSHIETIRF